MSFTLKLNLKSKTKNRLFSSFSPSIYQPLVCGQDLDSKFAEIFIMGYENHVFCAADLGKEKVVKIVFSLLKKIHDFWKIYSLQFRIAGKGTSENFPYVISYFLGNYPEGQRVSKFLKPCKLGLLFELDSGEGIYEFRNYHTVNINRAIRVSDFFQSPGISVRPLVRPADWAVDIQPDIGVKEVAFTCGEIIILNGMNLYRNRFCEPGSSGAKPWTAFNWENGCTVNALTHPLLPQAHLSVPFCRYTHAQNRFSPVR